MYLGERKNPMLKNFLASLGFGSAKIDLILDSHYVTMGQPVTGKILIKGGEVEQLIEGIEVIFCLSSAYSKGDHTVMLNENISSVKVTSDIFTIQPGETIEYPFHFICPPYLPVSSVNTRYFFQTNLEIKSGIDSKDRDFVDVVPTGLQARFLNAFRQLGFVHHAEGYTGIKQGAYQIIQFRPTDWLRGEYDEIVFMYRALDTANQISGFFELEKKARGIMGALIDELDLNEKKGRFSFGPDDLATDQKAVDTIRHFIIENSKNLYS